MVILALGFTPEEASRLGAEHPQTTDWGTLRVTWPELRTDLAGTYAAGDSVRGASLVVWAIRDGRDAAAAMLKDMAENGTDSPATKRGAKRGAKNGAAQRNGRGGKGSKSEERAAA